MRIIRVKNPDSFSRKSSAPLSKKPVQDILEQVRKGGDAALRRLEKKFGGADIKSFLVSKREIAEAYDKVTKEQLDAIKTARSNLAKTEAAMKKRLAEVQVRANGVCIAKSFEPLKTVGCYVPGGLAQYPSSAIMSIVPAKVAGVKKIVVVTPPNKQGKISPAVLVAADVCGADAIFKVGGAHAIAAFAFGTRSIPAVDKIVGPGGSFVTAAKYLVSDIVSIDMLAGPTELAIIADDSADPELVAADLISQSEHSPDTTCCLITTSSRLAGAVNKEVQNRISTIKRKEIVRSSLGTNGFIALCRNESDMVQVADNIAPEHLQIIARRQKNISKMVFSAGLILVGQNTPSSASDYLLGTNHILPTNRFGRSRGSLSVLDFVKVQTRVESSRAALQKIDKKIKALTESEDLPNHYGAVRARL